MEQVDPKVKQGFDDLVSQTREEAIHIMKIEMPKKLIHLSQLSKEINDCLSSAETKINVFDAVVPINEVTSNQLEKLKVELWDMINYIITVKFYIMLNQPKKEDGNTFGVEVQNEIINDLSNCLDSTRQLLMDMTNYFSTRATYVTNCRKNPYVADFVSCLQSYDSKQLLVISQMVIDIRNTYASLYDRLMKNYDYLVKPHGSSQGIKWDTMY